MSKEDLVSKCVAIQYGVFIAGVVLLVVVAFNWYSDYSNSCLANCKVQQQACKAECAPAPASNFAASKTAAVDRALQAASRFAGPSKYPQKSPFGASKNAKLDEKLLHEGFLNYSPVQSGMDFQTYYNVPGEDAPEYDPAKESLEQSVFDSHKEFVEDSYISTQGPSSTNVERDDEIGPVTRWGLRRINYTDVVPGDDARQVPSEYPEQVEQSVGTYVI